MRLDEILSEVLGASGDGVNPIAVMGGDKVPAKPMRDKIDQGAVSLNRSKKKARDVVRKKKIKVSREEEMDQSPNITADDTGWTDRMVHDFYNK